MCFAGTFAEMDSVQQFTSGLITDKSFLNLFVNVLEVVAEMSSWSPGDVGPCPFMKLANHAKDAYEDWKQAENQYSQLLRKCSPQLRKTYIQPRASFKEWFAPH